VVARPASATGTCSSLAVSVGIELSSRSGYRPPTRTTSLRAAPSTTGLASDLQTTTQRPTPGWSSSRTPRSRASTFHSAPQHGSNLGVHAAGVGPSRSSQHHHDGPARRHSTPKEQVRAPSPARPTPPHDRHRSRQLHHRSTDRVAAPGTLAPEDQQVRLFGSLTTTRCRHGSRVVKVVPYPTSRVSFTTFPRPNRPVDPPKPPQPQSRPVIARHQSTLLSSSCRLVDVAILAAVGPGILTRS